MHLDDREMSALGPVTDPLVSIPIPLRQRRPVDCFTYPPQLDARAAEMQSHSEVEKIVHESRFWPGNGIQRAWE